MAKTKIKPLSDYVLVEPIEEETTLPSGLVLPDTAKEKPQKGRVVAIGPGKKDENGKISPVTVQVGSIVMYKKWGGTEIKIGSKEYLLVKEEDLLALVEE